MSDPATDHAARKPRLRLLEEIPIERQGQRQVCLRDPMGIAEATILVPPVVYFILKHFDGDRTLRDVQEVFFRTFGEIVQTDKLADLVEELDRNHFIEGESFQAHRREVEAEFRRAPLRAPAHAGGGYEADPEKLLRQLDSFFLDPGGPGAPLPAGGVERGPERPVGALVAPHIDLRVGGPCAAWAYHALAQSPPPDVHVVLGTCHLPTGNLFTLTSKDFATPIGAVTTDKALVEAIARRLEKDPFEDELAHRREHSIEFQALFLAWLDSRRGTRIPIVPVLCGTFERIVRAGRDPLLDPEVAGLVRAVREALAERGMRAVFVAGADLAHVGLKFGDPERPTPGFLDHVREEDERLLSCVERADPAGFFREIEKDKDRRRICGFPPIYTMLAILDGRLGDGRLLRYEQWNDTAVPSTVSYASLVLYER